ncbi:MAG: class II fructose-bisphosphate aldolase [Planctomycetes bacterium]|nr:class II fructose-bisphosphate aldolase [Planctomycetota bacterium]
MPLEPICDLMGRARENGYAVGYFESWNVESLQGTIDAAEATRSPIVIGFNGDFLSRPGRAAEERIACYGAMGKAAAESAAVPCGLIFNECAQEDSVRLAVTSGFNLVMPADPSAPYDDYVWRVVELANYAHDHDVSIEAEIGELPSGATGKVEESQSSLTDPDLAALFVDATGIDLLSISIGNVHVLIEGEQELDLDRLARIREQVDIPLGLHGGTGIDAHSLRKAISMGITKVAYGTYLKQRYLAAVREALETDEINPHKLLGYGGPEDVMVKGRLAVRDAVLERIELLGCCGKA